MTTKQKKPGLTKQGRRKLRDPDGIVHVVWMRPRHTTTTAQFLMSASHPGGPLHSVTYYRKLPGGTTACGGRAYFLNGTWVDPTTAATCIACTVAP